MNKKRDRLLVLLVCVAAALLLRFARIHVPTYAEVNFEYEGAGISVEDPLSWEETVAVKKILWGKIRWPEFIYGYPACGFGRNYAIIIDGTRYMLSWDSCGTLCVENVFFSTGRFAYIDLSDEEMEILEEIFNSRMAE